MNEIEALTILSGSPMLGSIKIQLLLSNFESAINALAVDPELLRTLPGFTPKVLEHWRWWERDFSWEKNLELAKRFNVEIIPYTSPRYPKPLLGIPDYPIILYVLGELLAADTHSIAVVGSRNAGPYSLAMAETLSQDLTACGYTIISGLARGIDTAAHRGALKKGRTIAVIGSGLANIYPEENRHLAKQIAKNGALISEYPMEAPPERQNFPQRNRIVSGMTLGSLLVEAPTKSGAMITMHAAWKQRKRLFALPGRVEVPFSGNHRLIKEGKALLVENADEIDQTFNNLLSFSDQRCAVPELHSLPTTLPPPRAVEGRQQRVCKKTRTSYY